MSDSNDGWPDPPFDPPEFPEYTPPIDGYRPSYEAFRTTPEIVDDDQQYWDHHRRYEGELGRTAFDVAFVGADGFAEMFRSMALADPKPIYPNVYGGIVAVEDCCGDQIGFSWRLLDGKDEYGDDPVDHAMAVATNPEVAGAAVAMWYRRQFGRRGPDVRRTDLYGSQRERQDEEEWKASGIDIEAVLKDDVGTCAGCEATIPAGDVVWTATIPPGRTKEHRCLSCARALAINGADQGYAINGDDPRDIPAVVQGDSDE